MAVRTLRPALGVLVVLLLLFACAESQAGRFCRQQPCGGCYCGIPCWVRWFDYDGHTPPPDPEGYAISRSYLVHCFCCQGNKPISCDAGTSQCTGSAVLVNGNTPPPNMCGGGYGGPGCAFQGCTTGCVRLYAMVYDPCYHVLRFALPWEAWQVYAPLSMLGLPPAPPYK